VNIVEKTSGVFQSVALTSFSPDLAERRRIFRCRRTVDGCKMGLAWPPLTAYSPKDDSTSEFRRIFLFMKTGNRRNSTILLIPGDIGAMLETICKLKIMEM
jgi:hypothetical protein